SLERGRAGRAQAHDVEVGNTFDPARFVYEAGGDDVDSDLRAKRLRQAQAHVNQRGFRGAVGDRAPGWANSGDRAEVDDPADPLLSHRLDGGSAAEERPLDVDVVQPAPDLDGQRVEVLEWNPRGDAGVVDQD